MRRLQRIAKPYVERLWFHFTEKQENNKGVWLETIESTIAFLILVSHRGTLLDCKLLEVSMCEEEDFIPVLPDPRRTLLLRTLGCSGGGSVDEVKIVRGVMI